MSVILKADIKRKLKEIGLESGDNVIAAFKTDFFEFSFDICFQNDRHLFRSNLDALVNCRSTFFGEEFRSFWAL